MKQILIHNYPASFGTYSYMTVIKDGKESEPYYFADMPNYLLAMAIIIGNAQNYILNELKNATK